MPHPESAIYGNLALRALADALLKRRKAIRYHTRDFRLERGVDRKDGLAFGRLDLDVDWLDGRQYHFTVWEDSIAWISARRVEKKKGLTLDVGFHAEVWDLPAKVVVERIELSLHRESKEGLRRIWIPPVRQSPSEKEQGRP